MSNTSHNGGLGATICVTYSIFHTPYCAHQGLMVTYQSNEKLVDDGLAKLLMTYQPNPCVREKYYSHSQIKSATNHLVFSFHHLWFMKMSDEPLR